MLEHVEIGVHPLFVLERVGVGHQVPADAEGVDDLLHADGLAEVGLVAGRDVLRPADRLIGDPQRAEDLAVEVVLADQQRMDAAQELTRLGALNDAVVVRARQSEDLGHGIARE